MECPKCHGENLTVISETKTEGKDFSAGKGICGALLLGPVGLICGLCGKGKTTNSTNYWLCHDCGAKIKV